MSTLTYELKTYRLTGDGLRSYRGRLCVSPYPGRDTYASLVDTIATEEDCFDLPAAALPFRSVTEVRTIVAFIDAIHYTDTLIHTYMLYELTITG